MQLKDYKVATFILTYVTFTGVIIKYIKELSYHIGKYKFLKLDWSWRVIFSAKLAACSTVDPSSKGKLCSSSSSSSIHILYIIVSQHLWYSDFVSVLISTINRLIDRF